MNTKYLCSFAKPLILHLSIIGDLSPKAKIVKLGQECKPTELEGNDHRILFQGK